MKYLIYRQVKGYEYPLDKFAYVCRKTKTLLWSSVTLENSRQFDSEQEALHFLDSKWLKYGNKVNKWKPIKKSLWLKKYGYKLAKTRDFFLR